MGHLRACVLRALFYLFYSAALSFTTKARTTVFATKRQLLLPEDSPN